MNQIKFDKKCKCGPEFVCVRIIENCDDLKVGSIWLPANSHANSRLAHCLVEDVGHVAAEKMGIATGDYVLIDRLATFAHTQPIALLKYDSVIVKTNKQKNDFWPLRNMVFVEPDKKEAFDTIGSLVVPTSASAKLKLGTILKMNCDEDLKLGFKVGDRVLMTRGADVVELGEQTLYVYKHDMIVCTFED